MIHGDRSMRGVAIEYSESESYSYMNNRGQRVMETLSKEEAATVGLNHVKRMILQKMTFVKIKD